MNGAQALVSMPVSQPPVSARDAGASMQDAAAQEAAGMAFEDALGGVDQRSSPGDAGDQTSDDMKDAASQDGASTPVQNVSPQVTGGLAAALAAIGMPWAGSLPAQVPGTTSAGQDAAQTAATQAVDPLALLARALAANDSEPVAVQPKSGDEAVSDEFIDIRILGRERHLGIDESATTIAANLTEATSTDATNAKQATSSVVDPPVDMDAQRAMPPAVEAAPVQDVKTVQKTVEAAPQQTAAASQQATLAQQSASAGQTPVTERSAEDAEVKREPGKSAADMGKAPVTDGAPTLRVEPKTHSQNSGLESAISRGRDTAAAERELLPDAKDADDFAQLMQKGSPTVAASVTANSAANSGSSLLSAASQISDQLAAPAAREVITSVKTSGDTKVIELQLKPENLGSVTVRVSLKDDVISLRLEAQRADTAQQISREIDKLTNSLKQAGYVVDGVSAQQMDARTIGRIEAASGSSTSGGSTQGQAQSFGQGQSQGSGAGSQQSSNGRGGAAVFEPWGGANNDGQNKGLASERQTGLYV